MKVPARIYAGALDWSPYALLRMMHGDWRRPMGDEVDRSGHDPAARAMIVLIFWTYFETLMTWFYERATQVLPSAVAADLLNRYSSIGARLDRLHRVLFDMRFKDDLASAGFQDVAAHIERLQQRRNTFVHGDPMAIDDALVLETVSMMPRFHLAWITIFNSRCVSRPG